ncbi:MAG: leucyl/phenylalanyl-tRNA--protein transferase [Polyangiaceae bacterium]|nr:leucyl/phenylalanyl-tRNA--protein transferase [Polyangiaceae bacterium]
MKIPRLGNHLSFPPANQASPEGIVAYGGDFRVERLLLAYQSGIFPWPHKGLPLLWFSPNPRFVLLPSCAHVPKSLAKRMKKSPYEIRCDTAFSEVIAACGEVPRPGQDGTWVVPELVRGYEELHAAGFAHSIEAWRNNELVGGLYGVSLGAVFFGESMFAKAPDASKIAFATLLGNLAEWGFGMVDCQVYTDHLDRFGAEEWPRNLFLDALEVCLQVQTRRGKWQFDLAPKEALSVLKSASEEPANEP